MVRTTKGYFKVVNVSVHSPTCQPLRIFTHSQNRSKSPKFSSHIYSTFPIIMMTHIRSEAVTWAWHNKGVLRRKIVNLTSVSCSTSLTSSKIIPYLLKHLKKIFTARIGLNFFNVFKNKVLLVIYCIVFCNLRYTEQQKMKIEGTHFN